MSLLQNVWSDLVEKRLWPVVLGLLVALVAIPVLVTKGNSDGTPASQPLAAAPPAVHASRVVSLDDSTVGRRNAGGRVRNPFIQRHARSTTASSATPVGGAPATPVGGSQGGSPASSAPASGGSGPSPAPTTAPKPAPSNELYHLSLRFGAAGGMHVRDDVPRLTPLPSSSNPFFVFLGILADGKTAVFLVSSDAKADGDGRCRPTPSDCETIEMKAGDTEFFDVTQGTAGTSQYELDLLKVVTSKTTSRAVAARARKRIDSDGYDVVGDLQAEGSPSVAGYRYDNRRGLLVRRHVAHAARLSVGAPASGGAVPGAIPLFWPHWGH